MHVARSSPSRCRQWLAHLARHAVDDLFLGTHRPAWRLGATVRLEPSPRLLGGLLAREKALSAAEHDINHLLKQLY